MNLGMESCNGLAGIRMDAEETYARHQLEDRSLCHLKQLNDLLEAFQHGFVIPYGAGHAASQTGTQRMVNIELTWRTRSQERIVEACQRLVGKSTTGHAIGVLTICSCHGLLDGIGSLKSAHSLGLAVIGSELGNIQVERQVLLTERVAEEFTEQQTQGGILEDVVETGIVRVLGYAPVVITRKILALVTRNPPTGLLPQVGNTVDGVLGGLEGGDGIIRHGIRGIVLQHRDQAVFDEEFSNHSNFLVINRRAAVHQPIDGGLPSKGVVDYPVMHFALLGHLHTHQAIGIVAERIRIRAGDAVLHIWPILAGESPEDDFDGGAVMRQLVSCGISLQVDQLHGVAGGLKDFGYMAGGDAIPLAETLQDIDAFRGQNEQSTLEREIRDRFAIGGLDEPRINKALANGARHIPRHGEGGGGRGGDYARLVFRVWHSIRLGEFEGPQVVDGFLRCERVIIFRKADAMRI